MALGAMGARRVEKRGFMGGGVVGFDLIMDEGGWIVCRAKNHVWSFFFLYLVKPVSVRVSRPSKPKLACKPESKLSTSLQSTTVQNRTRSRLIENLYRKHHFF